MNKFQWPNPESYSFKIQYFLYKNVTIENSIIFFCSVLIICVLLITYIYYNPSGNIKSNKKKRINKSK